MADFNPNASGNIDPALFTSLYANGGADAIAQGYNFQQPGSVTSPSWADRNLPSDKDTVKLLGDLSKAASASGTGNDKVQYPGGGGSAGGPGRGGGGLEGLIQLLMNRDNALMQPKAVKGLLGV